MSFAEATVPAALARSILAGAAEHGVSAEALAAEAGLDLDLLDDGDARAPASTMLALWDAAGRLTGDESFGLRLGARTAGAAMALAGRLIVASATLGEGLARVFAYYRVFNDVHPASIEPLGDDVVVRVHTKAFPVTLPRHPLEFAFAWFVAVASRAVGEKVRLTRVSFEHAAPAEVREHEAHFGCEVAFGAAESLMVVPRGLFERPTASPDPWLIELLESHASTLLAKLPARASTKDRLRAVLGELLPRGDATIELAAEALGKSPRSLQRKLKEEATTFSDVVDELRCDRARELLGDRDASLAEIALRVGFSDQSAFHRAFVRWTGKTPGEFRKLAR